jgi:bifunctional non-homologous end joining protein LigD
MLATLGPLPTTPSWGYEFKWDGVRAIAYIGDGRVRIFTRNDRDVSESYPELQALAETAKHRIILDAEIVTIGPDGATSFGLLQQRMHVRQPGAALLGRVPVQLYAFDILHHDTSSTLKLPYTERRTILERLDLGDTPSKIPPYWTGDAGRDLLTAAADIGAEGVVAKRLESTYQPGRRSPAWVKTPRNRTVEVVIVGWKPGAGSRSGRIGSLLLGMYDDDGRLVYVGNVGTGFTQQMLVQLQQILESRQRPTSSFDTPVPNPDARDAHWTEPDLVGEVEFRNWTPTARLRHPSWRGLRPDREPSEARLPTDLT